jgi:hypothetical protein
MHADSFLPPASKPGRDWLSEETVYPEKHLSAIAKTDPVSLAHDWHFRLRAAGASFRFAPGGHPALLERNVQGLFLLLGDECRQIHRAASVELQLS